MEITKCTRFVRGLPFCSLVGSLPVATGGAHAAKSPALSAMERRTPPHLCNNNQNNNTVHGNNAVVLNFDPISNILQQSGTDSKIRTQKNTRHVTHADTSDIERLYKLLNPLESSTRRGINVPKDGCLVGTRRELLQQISSFASDTNPPHTCLILGLAGMGVLYVLEGFNETLT